MNGRGFVTLKTTAEHRTEVKGSLFVAYGGRADTPEQGSPFSEPWRPGIPMPPTCVGPTESMISTASATPVNRAVPPANPSSGPSKAKGSITWWSEWSAISAVPVSGAGGLVRAYGGTAAEALRTAERQEELPRTGITVEVPFEHMGALYRLLDSLGVEERRETYTEQGLKVMASLPESLVEHFRAGLRDATRGQSSLLEP